MIASARMPRNILFWYPGLCWVLLGLSALGPQSLGITPRIVSTSPSITEWIFQLGHGQDVVATSDYSDYPTEASALPRIGSLFMPNLERIFRYAPTWILIDEYASAPSFIAAANQHAQTLRVKINSVSQLFAQSRLMLQRIYPQENTVLLSKYEQLLNLASNKHNDPFTFLVLVWTNPVILYGNDLFLIDIIKQLGGKNLVPDAIHVSYPQVSQEWLIKHRPDVLFFISDFPEMKNVVASQAQRWWPNKKVHLRPLPGSHFARTSFTPILHLDEILSGPIK